MYQGKVSAGLSWGGLHCMFESQGVEPELMPSVLSETGGSHTCTPSTAILLSLSSCCDELVNSQPLLMALALPSLPCPPPHGRCPAPPPHGCSARWACSGLHMGSVIHFHQDTSGVSSGPARAWDSTWVGRRWHTCGRQGATASACRPSHPHVLSRPYTPAAFHQPGF